MTKTEKNRKVYLIFIIILMLQVIAAFCFCMKKTGFHYDEYYSYYSSNVTYGLVPTNREWKSGEEIRNEFQVLPGEGFNFETVVRMQTYDVHPPFYYILLHAVCSLTPGNFSKWSALGLNLVLFVFSWVVLALLTWKITAACVCSGASEKEKWAKLPAVVTGAVCLLYGFNPAVLSGVMMARMYTLLGFFVLAVTLLHVQALINRRRCWKFYAAMMLTVYLGFLTHYYYAVYMFFLAAAMECYLLFEKAEQKSWRQKWKDCISYGAAVVGAMAAAVISYPACLGHIFRGYRGTEALGEFFNVENTAGRVQFFSGLLNEYVFGSMLPFLLLVIVLLGITAWSLKRVKKTAGAQQTFWERDRVLWITGTAVTGYFLVVAKTALLNAEEAIRYPLPVFGLLLMFAVIAAALLLLKCFPGLSMKWNGLILTGIFAVLLFGEGRGLLEDRVLFLYEEDAGNIAFAQENHDVPVMHFYNGNLTWMIWDESLELMQYDEIYFVNKADLSPISEEKLAAADRIFVYVARGDDVEEALDAAKAAMGEGIKAEKIRELLYCDLYELTR
ncbi:MAG: hypothetical protein IJ390_09895 [Lachnospiraceae bacterium]|nr:hypothetical protein [Lachnospiraceae bacterium]